MLRPSRFVPFMVWMACWASAVEENSMQALPRDSCEKGTRLLPVLWVYRNKGNRNFTNGTWWLPLQLFLLATNFKGKPAPNSHHFDTFHDFRIGQPPYKLAQTDSFYDQRMPAREIRCQTGGRGIASFIQWQNTIEDIISKKGRQNKLMIHASQRSGMTVIWL